MVAMPLAPGDHVDRYEIVAFLGSGGMGEVYRARDSKLQRHIALKVLRGEGSPATDGRQRLLREARAVAALSHPNVLSVFDVGEVTEPENLRGMAYIAMELVVGSSLRAHLGDATVPFERRMGWLRDIARALSAAHEAGLVHRDVKPENVMIRSDGVVKVLDFGIARHIERADALSSTEGQSLSTLLTDLGPPVVNPQGMVSTRTAPGRIVGTLYYMAPEQLRGETIDGRADQFAWGVVAYELLTGKRPWSLTTDAIGIASQILAHSPPSPARLDPLIAVATSDVVMRALSKSAAERFPTMDDLLSSFTTSARVAEGRSAPISAQAPEILPRSRRRARMPSWLAYVLGAMALIAVVGKIISALRVRGESKPTETSASHAAAIECTSNAECSHLHGNRPWRCHSVRHECIEIDSVDCKARAQPADLANDETVWVGAMYPITGHEAKLFSPEARALDLARQDFASALVSRPSGASGLGARPIGIVMCDESTDPVRAAKHLANDVEVPAVVGFRSAPVARALVPGVFLPSKILSFIAISQAPDLNRLPEPPNAARLVWRSTLNGNDTAPPIASLIDQVLEPHERAERSMEPSFSLRIARTRADDAYDVADEQFRILRFNGKSAMLNGDDFRQYVVPSGDADANSVVESLLAFHPQVIFVSGPAFATKVLAPLEKRWGHAPRPTYLIASGEFDAGLVAFAGKDPDRRHRFFGVTNMSTRMTNAQLVLRYNLAFPNEPVMRTNAPSPSYDAFYTIAYAILALGDEPITGPSISRALDRLQPPGRPIDVGPQGIFDAFTTLRSGQNIDLNGAIGNLDFNRETGEAPIDYAIVCLNVDDHGAASGSVESGLVYDAASKKLTGTMHCP